MSKTEYGGLEQNTSKERLDRVEETLLKLGKALDYHSYYLGCGWEDRIRNILGKKK